MSTRILEVCAYTIQSCLIAERAGAGRVELCDNAAEGGTTPSYGVIKQARDRLSIDLYPIIRPRPGNFLYDADEYAIIQKDIACCKELHCDGISVGTQNARGGVDTEWLKRIVEWAWPLKVTFNRAFDRTPDPFEALEELIDCGCVRLLSSGQKASAFEGGELLKKLVQAAGDRLVVMPGAGIRSHNLLQLADLCQAREYHTSARIAVGDAVPVVNGLAGEFGDVFISDEEEVRKMAGMLK
jgi:copper homeostasis protein